MVEAVVKLSVMAERTRISLRFRFQPQSETLFKAEASNSPNFNLLSSA